MRAVLYARVSSEEQLDGYSLEAQLEAMRGYCDSRGWIVVAEFVEPGFTARTDQRPVFKEVMESCKAGRCDILVTHKLDRAFRSLIDQLQGIMRLERWGVSYVSVSEQIDVSTPSGKMFLSMLGALNQYFSDNLATEVRKGKKQRAKNGLSNASRSPYGYERVDGVDVIVPEQAEVLKLMYEMYSTGVYSYKALAEFLNEEGYPAGAWSTNGKWSLRAVEIALKNPFYVGKVIHQDVEYDGQHDPIIPQTLWEKVQATLKRRGKHFSRRAKKPYLLQSLLKCDYCGRTMWCASPRGGPSYYKDPAGDYGIECPGPSYMRADTVDPQIEAVIRKTRVPEDWRQRIVELQETREEPSKKKPLLEKLRRLKDLYIDGDISRGEYNRRKSDTERELASMETPSKARIQQAGVMLESIGDIWDAATTAEKNEILRAIFVEIGIKDGKITWFKVDTPFTPLFREIKGWEEDVEKGIFHVEEAEF